MTIQVISRKADGSPAKLLINNGYMEYTKDAGPEDSYVDQLLDSRDFLSVQIGNETRDLINTVNRLLKENAALRAQNERYMKAAGF